jgi:threonine synthase
LRCACGSLLDVEHALDPPPTRALFEGRPERSGVWRFVELVDPDLPAEERISLHEGGTPLYESTPALARAVGSRGFLLKHEGLNPTGSFKDRGMTVAVSRAVHAGARWLACASTGNTAASLAAFAARGDARALVLVPAGGVTLGKLGQALAYGARVAEVRGDFDAAMRAVRALAEDGRVALVNSANPWRVEGQKTIVLELLVQLGWEPPDWLVFPAGNLGNCAAFGKALREARAAGLIARAPRLLAVQAAGAAPFAEAAARGFGALRPVRAETLASAIRIGDPVSYARAVRALRETNGRAIAVSDADILRAKAAVDAAGIGAEPASCAAVAGLAAALADGLIGATDSVVCVLTGHLLKDPETTLAWHRGELPGAPRGAGPVTVDADAEQLARLLDG